MSQSFFQFLKSPAEEFGDIMIQPFGSEISNKLRN